MTAAVEAITRLLPRPDDYAGLSRTWRGDIVAGLTVGVVALPLALAFGISSGLGAEAGLITAIIAGVLGGVLGGSNVQISGPTGAMAVVLVPVVARFGADAVILVGLVAGALLVIAAFLRLGRVLAYVPWPVIEGFTVGIAIIIFLQQVPAALGVEAGDSENTAVVAWHAVTDAFTNSQLATVAIVMIVVTAMLLLPRLHRTLPASLIAVALATVVAELAGFEVARIGALPSSLPMPSLPAVSAGAISQVFSAALAVAALAALESLLSAKVADGMAGTGRHDPDRELFGQGIANLVTPLFGGMPATGAIARTAVNVRAGAHTRLATVVHSLLLAGVVFAGSSLVGQIPLAALAGVLMVTAVRMVEIHNVRAVLLATRSDGLVLIATAGATVAFDLIVAVEIGIAVAAVLALRQVAQSAVAELDTAPRTSDEEFEAEAASHDGIICYRLGGALFFGAAQRFLTEITAVSDVQVVVLRMPDLQVLDATGAQALGEIIAELEGRGITVLLKGPRPQHLQILRTVGAIDRLAHANHLFEHLDDALEHARSHVDRSTRSPAA